MGFCLSGILMDNHRGGFIACVAPPAVPEKLLGPQVLARDVNLGVKKLHVSILATSSWLTWKMLFFFFLHDVDQTKTCGSSVNKQGEPVAALRCFYV